MTLSGQCVDYENAPSDTVANLEQGCEQTSAAHWLNGPCDRTGAVGGCRVQLPPGSPPNMTFLYWWWPGSFGGGITDVASAKATCAQIKGVFVDP